MRLGVKDYPIARALVAALQITHQGRFGGRAPSHVFPIFVRFLVERRVVAFVQAENEALTPPLALPENYPDWAAILGREAGPWKMAIRTARRGQHVLIATSVGGYTPGVFLEAALAVALTLRGARVHLLLCDGCTAWNKHVSVMHSAMARWRSGE